MKKYDVVALGELLIDFTENGLSKQGNYLMEANPGGAPCNVLAMLTRLGKKAAFIGKVGNDFFGRYLKETVTELGIDTQMLFLDEEVNTTLAFVHTLEEGERTFSFYRNPGADTMLHPDEITEEVFTKSRLFHFGSLSLTHVEAREATKKAVRLAKENGCLVSFDPNLRESLWSSLQEAKEQITYGMGQCDILKISDNEIQWFTGKQDFDEGIHILQEQFQIPLILLSMGKQGSRAYYNNLRVEAGSYLMKNTIETTGAGDTFCACVLNYLLEHDFNNLTEEGLLEMLRFANAAAALITTRKGALRVMPVKEEVERVIGLDKTK